MAWSQKHDLVPYTAFGIVQHILHSPHVTLAVAVANSHLNMVILGNNLLRIFFYVTHTFLIKINKRVMKRDGLYTYGPFQKIGNDLQMWRTAGLVGNNKYGWTLLH